jgi:hypothetical protein
LAECIGLWALEKTEILFLQKTGCPLGWDRFDTTNRGTAIALDIDFVAFRISNRGEELTVPFEEQSVGKETLILRKGLECLPKCP